MFVKRWFKDLHSYGERSLMKRVLTGCCGWAVKGGKQAYFRKFPVIELQETFYRLPRVETAAKWRADAPHEFIFCMKAWQAISHPVSSPTWRRSGIPVHRIKNMRYGFLRPMKENFKAWEKTAEIARVLNAKIVVIQTPPSMPNDETTVSDAVKFFEYASTFGITLAWEPRGKLAANREAIRKICEKSLIHVVDLLRTEPIEIQQILYTRLHGLGKREVNYSYRYTDNDLSRLMSKIEQLNVSESYVMFNNVSMADDAQRFMNLLNR